MPTYVYRCRKGHTFELFHSMTDDGVKRCPKCKTRAQRVPAGGAGLIFKGSGFHITDYRSKNYKEGARREKSGGDAKPAAGADGKPAAGGDAKPAAGADAKPAKGAGGASGPGGEAKAAPAPRSKIIPS
jgi:putative FmdB family regulatory protein